MQLILTDSRQLSTYVLVKESRHEKTAAFSVRLETNMAVMPQTMDIVYRLAISDRFCYQCSANINVGVVQVPGYRAADLCLCFRICKKAGFLITRLKIGLISGASDRRIDTPSRY